MVEVRGTIVRQPVTVGPSTTIRDAAREMERQGVGALLVVEDDRLIGIVTDRDIVLRGVARNVPPDGRIDALMTTEVITIPSGVDVERAYELFRDHAFRRLPVVDGRRLVGLLAVDDLLIRSEHELAELVHPLVDEIFAPHREAPALAPTTQEPATAAPELPPRRLAMRARPGDTLVVHGHTTTQPDRLGEIFEVRSPAGDPPFAVRWSDTGHVGFIYPGVDAESRHRGQEARSGVR
jgi:CBS domain-containing protein